MDRTSRRVAVLVALSLSALCSTAAAAPFGASDNAFSGDGWTTLIAGKDYTAQANAVALQPDRKILSGGFAFVAGHSRFALTRHTLAGPLDAGFGDAGVVLTQLGNTDTAAVTDLAVLSNGGILAVGTAREENQVRIALARYTAGGVLDPGFGTGGKVVDAMLADGATATSLALAADGDLLVTGQIRDGAASKAFIRRFTADGTPDASFGTNGLRTYTVGDTGCSTAKRIFTQSDGSIIVIGGLCRTGAFNAPAVSDGYVLKLDDAGLRQTGFGSNGLALSTIAEGTFSSGIVDSQGRFVLVGSSKDSSLGSYYTTTAVGRLTAAGTTDTSFGGGDGLTEIADDDILAAIDADQLSDGRLWITATASVGSNPILGAWGSALLAADGTPITTYGFAGTGAQANQIGFGQTTSSEAPSESLVDNDGATETLLQVGRASNTIKGGFLEEDSTFGLRRYSLPKGQPVAPFNGYSGSSTRVGLTASVTLRRLRPLADGSVLVAGSAVDTNLRKAAIWKLGANGTPDATWAGGVVIENVGAGGSHANDAQPGLGTAAGKIYVTGQATDTDDYDTLAVMRHTATGALDSGFSGDGIVLVRLRPTGAGAGTAPVCTATPPLCRDDDGTAGSGGDGSLVLPLADGGVLVIGSAGDQDSVRGGARAYRVVLARLAADGTPVSGFGTGGIVQLYRNGIVGGSQRPFAATLRGADKVLIAAILGNSSGYGPVQELQFDLATGALDPAFSGDGFAEATAPANSFLSAMRFVSGDSLAVSGYAGSPFSPLLGRFAGAAEPLAGFGAGGFATLPVAGTNTISATGIDQLPGGPIVAAVAVTDRLPRTVSAIGVNADASLAADFGSGGLLSTARSCGNFNATDVAVDPTGRLLLAGGGNDPAIGTVGSVSRFIGGAPSAPIPCPPTTGAASLTGPDAGPLSCAPASFDGASPLSYAYEWLREASVITGASANTYALTGDDAGHLLACRIRGANAYGSYGAISNARRAPGTIVVEPEPTTTPAPGPTAEPVPTVVAVATAAPTPPAPPAKPGTITPAAIKPSAVFTLPSNKKCVSRRSFRIRVRAPKGVKLASATVRVNNKLLRTVKGKRLTAPVDLRGLPKGKFTVKVEAKTTDGRAVRDSRTYKTCAPKKKG